MSIASSIQRGDPLERFALSGPTPVCLQLDLVRKAYEIAGAPENLSVHHYPRYSDPANRRDGKPIPEGLGEMEWLDHANVDVPRHYFKGDLAVPWLTKQFKLPDPGQVYPPAPPEGAK